MKYQKQLSLFPNQQKLFHGGVLVRGQRKSIRPLCTKRSLHLVLKARRKVLFTHRKKIAHLVRRYSERFSLKVYDLSVQQDHIHALIKIDDRESYVRFIRSLSGQLARQLGKNLFKVSPFTRVVAWGKSFQRVKAYLLQNEKEVLGEQEYVRRKDHYKRHKKPPADAGSRTAAGQRSISN